MGTATTADDLIASYSSKGPSFIDDIAKPDLVAPGNLVVGLKYANDALAIANPNFVTLNSFYTNTNNGQGKKASTSYFPLSGTSMSTGVTSGAVALLLGAQPSLTPDQTKALLMLSANRSMFPQTSSVTDGGVTYNANYDVFTVGAGYLDINAALTAAASTPVPAGTAMSPVGNLRSQQRQCDARDGPDRTLGSYRVVGRFQCVRRQRFCEWFDSTVGSEHADRRNRAVGCHGAVGRK